MMTAPGGRVAMPLAQVRHVMRTDRLEPLPLARPEVAGIVVREGRVIPVYRLADLASPGQRSPADARGPGAQEQEIVVIEEDGAMAGILVDRTEAVKEIPVGGDTRAVEARSLLTAAGAIDPGAGHSRTASAVQGERLES